MTQVHKHALARAALQAQIAAGAIAHHSGRADDFYRATTRRLRQLWQADRGPVELRRDGVGQYRVTIDTAAGYWDHVIPRAEWESFAC